MNIGVLALQGDFAEHVKTLQKLGVKAKEVRLPTDLKELHGLIIPGGESTAISNLMQKYTLGSAIKKANKKGMAVFGTCAGAIIVSKKILDDKKVKPLKLIEMEVQRNAYGRQKDSFETELKISGEKNSFKAAFIRAPIISKTGKNVEVLCMHEKQPVLVRQGNVLAGTFHTELSGETAVHEIFLGMIKK